MMIKSIKVTFLLIWIFLRRKRFPLIALVLALSVVAGAFLNFKDLLFRPVLIEGIVGTHTEENLPEGVTRLLSRSLVDVNNIGSPSADLVSGWNVNSEATEYTFTLGDEYWVDGTRIASQDIDIYIQNTQVARPDDKTLSIKLPEPFSPLPTLLTKPVFKNGKLTIGSGPYKINYIKKEKDQVFIKEIALKSQDKKLPDVLIRFYPNEKIAKNALALGRVHALFGVNDATDTIEKTLSNISITNFNRIVTIFYNTKDPLLSNENFRLALSYAAPSIKDEVEAKTSIPPNSWAFNDDVKDYLDNPELAKNETKKVGKSLEETVTLTATPFLKDVGERVVEEWKKNGINSVLRVESGIPQNFQALLIAQNIHSDPDQYFLWHSTQPQTNISKISSPRIDKDLEDGRRTSDFNTRKARYKDFQKVLLDQAPATFLYFPKFNVLYRDKFEALVKEVLKIQLTDL